MKSWKFGAVVLSVVAIGAMGCGSSESTSTMSGGTGGSKETSSSAGGAGGASTGTMASTGTESPTTTGTSMTTGTMATGTSTGTGMSTSSSSSTGTGGGTCAAATDCSLCKANDKTCGECCGKSNPAAQSKYISLLVGGCVCNTAAPCFSACGGMGNTMPMVCTDPSTPPSQACAMCVNGLGMNACVMKAQQSCFADAVCKDLITCAQSCMGP